MSTKKKYPQVHAGQAIEFNWHKKDYLVACCDCHLVHRFRFIVAGHTLRIRTWRDNRKTAALRRHRGIPVKDGPLTENLAQGTNDA